MYAPTRATDHKHINHGTISVVRVPYPSRRIRQYENYANYGGAIAPHHIFMYTFYHCSALSHVSPQNLGPWSDRGLRGIVHKVSKWGV